MNLAFNIKRRRMELGVSQEELAKKLGYKSRSAIAKIESGQSDIPFSKLLELSHALDTSIHQLLAGVDQEPQSGGGSATAPGRKHRNIGVILAGGQSTRNLQNIPNQFINVMGRPVITYCLETYQRHPLIDEIFVVCRGEWRGIVEAYSREYGIDKLRGLIPAGPSGVTSAFKALDVLTRLKYKSEDVVVFQESTRPFVTEEMVTKLLSTCQKYGSAITCETMEDYVQYQVEGKATRYLKRDEIVDLQSPDAHTIEALADLLAKAKSKSHRLNESCIGLLMSSLGMNLNFCEGNHNNIKIVRQEDLAIFQALLKTQKL